MRKELIDKSTYTFKETYFEMTILAYLKECV